MQPGRAQVVSQGAYLGRHQHLGQARSNLQRILARGLNITLHRHSGCSIQSAGKQSAAQQQPSNKNTHDEIGLTIC
ncbi:hypothetical protein D9M69_620070 [compost metagenome]